MTGPIVFEAPDYAPISIRARFLLTVLACLVLLVVVGVVEVGVLAAASVMSSTTNHAGIQ
jgi:hypothetical protein